MYFLITIFTTSRVHSMRIKSDHDDRVDNTSDVSSKYFWQKRHHTSWLSYFISDYVVRSRCTTCSERNVDKLTIWQKSILLINVTVCVDIYAQRFRYIQMHLEIDKYLSIRRESWSWERGSYSDTHWWMSSSVFEKRQMSLSIVVFAVCWRVRKKKARPLPSVNYWIAAGRSDRDEWIPFTN